MVELHETLWDPRGHWYLWASGSFANTANVDILTYTIIVKVEFLGPTKWMTNIAAFDGHAAINDIAGCDSAEWGMPLQVVDSITRYRKDYGTAERA